MGIDAIYDTFEHPEEYTIEVSFRGEEGSEKFSASRFAANEDGMQGFIQFLDDEGMVVRMVNMETIKQVKISDGSKEVVA